MLIGTRERPHNFNRTGGHRVPTPTPSLNLIHPAFTELPIMSAWGEKAEEDGRRKQKREKKCNHRVTESFAPPLLGTTGLPEHISSHIFINTRVSSCWLASRSTSHPITASLATRCLRRDLHAGYQYFLQNRGQSRETEKHVLASTSSNLPDPTQETSPILRPVLLYREVA